MPELPEVESIRQGLLRTVKGLLIKEVQVIDARVVRGISAAAFRRKLAGRWQVRVWTDMTPKAVVHDETEELWKTYCNSITISERKNRRLQKQHIPLKYRPYLPEYQDQAGD